MPDLPDADVLFVPRAHTRRAAVLSMTGRERAPVVVVTAAVIEHEGRFLVTRRPRGVHLEGLWEFPGGKCEPGEALESCLKREIDEELGTGATVNAELFTVAHSYSERTVELHFFACVLNGEPRPVLGQEMRWVSREELRDLAFPPADAELIERLTAPK